MLYHPSAISIPVANFGGPMDAMDQSLISGSLQRWGAGSQAMVQQEVEEIGAGIGGD